MVIQASNRNSVEPTQRKFAVLGYFCVIEVLKTWPMVGTVLNTGIQKLKRLWSMQFLLNASICITNGEWISNFIVEFNAKYRIQKLLGGQT